MEVWPGVTRPARGKAATAQGGTKAMIETDAGDLAGERFSFEDSRQRRLIGGGGPVVPRMEVATAQPERPKAVGDGARPRGAAVQQRLAGTATQTESFCGDTAKTTMEAGSTQHEAEAVSLGENGSEKRPLSGRPWR